MQDFRSIFNIYNIPRYKSEKPLSAMDKEADKTIVHPEVLSQSKIPY